MSVTGISGIVPPVGGTTKHVQSKEKTLTNDVYRHGKLAKKEMKAANKLEHKAHKVFFVAVCLFCCLLTLINRNMRNSRKLYEKVT